ncbi:MAG: hypothetical protein AB9897_03355 [Anaerolineaceae bacterium]
MSSTDIDHSLQIRTETDIMLFQPPRKWTPLPECVNCPGLISARSKLNQNIGDYGGVDFYIGGFYREIRCYVSADSFSSHVDLNLDFLISETDHVSNSKAITTYPKSDCLFYIKKLNHESPERIDKNNPESFLRTNF